MINYFISFFTVYYTYSSNHSFVSIDSCKIYGLLRITKTTSRTTVFVVWKQNEVF